MEFNNKFKILMFCSIFVVLTSIVYSISTSNLGNVNIKGNLELNNTFNSIYYIEPDDSIQQALDIAKGNSLIYFMPGVYDINNRINITEDNVTLVSIGAVLKSSIRDEVIQINSSNVQFNGFTFEFSGRDGHVSVESLGDFTTENIVFRNNIFRSQSRNGMIFLKSFNKSSKIRDFVFDGNKVYNQSRTGLGFNSELTVQGITDVYDGVIQDVTVKNNYFTGVPSTPNDEFVGLITIGTDSGIGQISNINIINNIMRDIRNNGITYGVKIQRDANVSNVRIESNVFKNLVSVGNNSVYGVFAGSSDYFSFNDNECENIFYTGTGNAESHCAMISNSASSLPRIGSVALFNDNILINISSNCDSNFNCKDGEGFYCKSNYCGFVGNVFFDAGTNYGISLAGSTYDGKDGIISDNIFTWENFEPHSAGVRIYCHNCSVKDNIFSGLGTGMVVNLFEADNIIVEGNSVYDSTGFVGWSNSQSGGTAIIKNNDLFDVKGYFVNTTGFKNTIKWNNYGNTNEDYNFQNKNIVNVSNITLSNGALIIGI